MIEHYQSIIDQRIDEFILDNSSKKDFEIIKYILDLKGKRIRPSLLLLSVDIFNGNVNYAVDQAVDIELFHNFTLLHDDIMDEAPLRRGKQSVHLKWDTNRAILAGDILFAYANSLMSKCSEKHLANILKIYNKTAIEVCEGQQLDLDLEKRQDAEIDEYIEMIKLKTSVLLACALKIGAILSDAEQKDIDLIYNFGLNLGIAFQIHDDLLDVYADDHSFGKQLGGDIIEGKKTALYFLAEQYANDDQKRLLNNSELINNSKKRIESIINIYDLLDVKQKVKVVQQQYFTKALNSLNELSVSEIKKEKLVLFADNLMKRTY